MRFRRTGLCHAGDRCLLLSRLVSHALWRPIKHNTSSEQYASKRLSPKQHVRDAPFRLMNADIHSKLCLEAVYPRVYEPRFSFLFEQMRTNRDKHTCRTPAGPKNSIRLSGSGDPASLCACLRGRLTLLVYRTACACVFMRVYFSLCNYSSRNVCLCIN